MSMGISGGTNVAANPWGGAQAYLAQLMRGNHPGGMTMPQAMPGWQQQFGQQQLGQQQLGMLNQQGMPGWQAQITPPPATSLVPPPVAPTAATTPAPAAAATQRGQGVDPGAAAALPLEQRRLLNFDPLTNTYY